MEAIGINVGYVFVQIASFIILYLVLKSWAFDPIANMINDRREKINKGLEDAQVAAEARASAEKDAEKIIADAQAKATEIVREATVRAEGATADIKTAAEADAVKIRKEAREEASETVAGALSGLRSDVAAIAMAATQKLVGVALDETRGRALIDEFFSGVKAGKVTVLEGVSMAGGEAEVVSALPLTDKEQAAVKKDVLSKLGDAATVTFRVDPKILGGLVIKVGDKVMDSSVAGQLSAMRENVR